MTLYIKFMVSQRCKIAVADALNKLGLNYKLIELGIVEIENEIDLRQQHLLNNELKTLGLELLNVKKEILVERIKNIITEMVHYSDECPDVNDSQFISNKMGYDYTYLANIFSETKGVTLQQYIIQHKIERVKELISYDELSLSEISYKMHYSSAAHLSNQFKKNTGVSPSFYKQLRQHRKETLENV